MNNAEIRAAIKDNLISSRPATEPWTARDEAILNSKVMDAEKAMKTLREANEGLSRLEAWSEIKTDFLTA